MGNLQFMVSKFSMVVGNDVYSNSGGPIAGYYSIIKSIHALGDTMGMKFINGYPFM